ncbi:hypothetical protein [Sodalis-like secondary symbiont of Drepanosiphum platanoidis]|uniref:hypothetical protein n=1 Tax=Sodalis-like secondary symbiont of Drepanosiphum platanoidis TaxID=2994493 RepID=UPI0034642D2F
MSINKLFCIFTLSFIFFNAEAKKINDFNLTKKLNHIDNKSIILKNKKIYFRLIPLDEFFKKKNKDKTF